MAEGEATALLFASLALRAGIAAVSLEFPNKVPPGDSVPLGDGSANNFASKGISEATRRFCGTCPPFPTSLGQRIHRRVCKGGGPVHGRQGQVWASSELSPDPTKRRTGGSKAILIGGRGSGGARVRRERNTGPASGLFQHSANEFSTSETAITLARWNPNPTEQQ